MHTIRVNTFFFTHLKLCVVYAFVPRQKINCVTADKLKFYIRYVTLITINFDPQMVPMKHPQDIISKFNALYMQEVKLAARVSALQSGVDVNIGLLLKL